MAQISTKIDQAVAALKQGELVVFPTETVYGLGADAANPQALKKLYAVKERPLWHPVIVHIASADDLNKWSSNVSEIAYKLADTFWPGPLTMILPAADHVLPQVTGGQKTIGLRMPSHPLALELLREFKGGIAAPSANKFGQLSPTLAQDVQAELGDEVALILDGGACEVGIESTIVDLSSSQAQILRPGMILQEHIEAVLGQELKIGAKSKDTPRFSGGLPSHYAPKTKLVIVESGNLKNAIVKLESEGKKVVVLTLGNKDLTVENIACAENALIYARSLYGNLRLLDKKKADIILVEQIPRNKDWVGIADRLQRAAAETSSGESK